MADDRPREPDSEEDEPLGLDPIGEDEPKDETGTMSIGDVGALGEAGDAGEEDDDIYSLAPPEKTKSASVAPPVPVAEPMDTEGDTLPPDEGTVEVLAQAPYVPPIDRAKTVSRDFAEDGEEDLPLPTLSPFDGFGLVTWPFRGREAASWIAVFAVVVICHMGAWGVQFAPIFGIVASYMILAGIWYYTAPFQIQVVLAAIRGDRGPPAWPRFSSDTTARGDALRVMGLQAMYFLPAVVMLVKAGVIPGLVVFLIAVVLYPLSLLLLAVSGSLLKSLPFPALLYALADPKRYLIVLAPAGAYLLAFLGAVAADPGFFLAVIFALSLPIAVYTSLLIGLMGRESRLMTALVLKTERKRQADMARLEEDWAARKRAMDARMAEATRTPRASAEDAEGEE